MEADPNAKKLECLSVIIPARDEEGCIASTVEHLHLELRLHDVPHEIIAVDDGSLDRTWDILNELKTRIPVLFPFQNNGQHGFGRAVICGLDHMQGDAAVVMMADESDDARDVVRTGEAKLKIKEMGSRYMFICLHVWLEKYFRRRDHRKPR